MNKKKNSSKGISTEEKERCKELWLNGGYSKAELAELFSVTTRSLRNWTAEWGDPKLVPLVPVPELTAEILRDDMAGTLTMIQALKDELFRSTKFDAKVKLDMMLKTIEKISEIEKAFAFMEGMTDDNEVSIEVIRFLYRKVDKKAKKEAIELYGDLMNDEIIQK